MGKGKLFLIGFVLIFLIIPFISSQEIISFEDVLEKYDIPESKLVGRYNLNESSEIPIYEFTYIYKEDWFGNFIGKFFKIFGIKVYTRDSKIPAIQMYVEDWEKYGHLLVRSPKDVKPDFKLENYEFELIIDNSTFFVPQYRVVAKLGEMRTHLPAVEVGPLGLGNQKILAMLAGKIYLTKEECEEHNGRATNISNVAEMILAQAQCNLPQERDMYPGARVINLPKPYYYCCLPVDNYESLRVSGYQGITA